MIKNRKKIIFLSRYQKTNLRGAEVFVLELYKRLARNNQVAILSGKESCSLTKILSLHPYLVIPINGRIQSLKASLGRLVGGYKVLICGHSGIGRDDLWNILVCKPDVFVALTNYQATWAKKWAWGTRVIKIPDGVDLKKFTPNGPKLKLGLQRPIILSVGALSWYKHHERVIEAVSNLKQGSLLIVGQGEEYERLLTLGKMKLGSRFQIRSFSYSEMPKVYRSADLFTLPSWDREAFGMVYLEAMASGLGVVAPNDPPRREIIGNAGTLVDVSNPQTYMDGIKQALATKWDDKPRKQVEKFSWDKIAQKYEKVLEEMVNG